MAAPITAPLLQFSLRGVFQIRTASGEEVTPKSAKAQGLLALLCCSPNFSRTRRWLRGKLWSDRSPDQANASLRQALSEIRREFGAHRDCLKTDRSVISLEASLIKVLTWDEPSDVEFMEGCDVRDPSFEDWLNTTRQKLARPLVLIEPQRTQGASVVSGARHAMSVTMRTSFGNNEIDRFFADVVAGDIARSLRDFTTLPVQFEDNIGVSPANGLVIDVGALSSGGQMMVKCRGSWLDQRGTFWMESRRIEGHGAPPFGSEPVLQLVNESVMAISRTLVQDVSVQDPTANVQLARILLAVQDVFSLDEILIRSADRVLEAEGTGPYETLALSWRAILRVVLAMERMTPTPEITKAEALMLSEKAYKADPYSSIVLAARSYATMMVLGNAGEGAELARRSTEINPANPFGWLARGFCCIALGQHMEAEQYMFRGRALESKSPHRFWWDTMAGVAATANGKFDIARRLLTNAHALKPNFKPPLRYLLALNAQQQDHDLARMALSKLMVLEPDFAVTRLIEDEAYPAAVLRKTGIVTPKALQALI